MAFGKEMCVQELFCGTLFMEHVIEDKQRALETMFLFVRCNLDPFKGMRSHRAFSE